jgi:hypothetical protein
VSFKQLFNTEIVPLFELQDVGYQGCCPEPYSSTIMIASTSRRCSKTICSTPSIRRGIEYSLSYRQLAFGRRHPCTQPPASIAIILWSVSTLRNGGLGRGVAIYGCVVSPLIIVGIGIGHLRLDVQGMAVVMLGQVVWFILVGSQLCSRQARGVSLQ